VGHIIVDAHSEMLLWDLLKEIVEDGLHVTGRELLAAKAVVSPHDLLEDASLAHSRKDIRVQRERWCKILLGAIQHRNRLYGLWKFG